MSSGANEVVDTRRVLALFGDLLSQSGPECRGFCPQSLRTVLRAVLDLSVRPGEQVMPADGHPGVMKIGSSEEAERPGFGAMERVLLDGNAWLAWMNMGLALFATAETGLGEQDEGTKQAAREAPPVPALRVVVSGASEVAIVLAMVRYDGNLTYAARALGTSRRSLRQRLKTAGLYPWKDVVSWVDAGRGEGPGEHGVGDPQDGGDDAA